MAGHWVTVNGNHVFIGDTNKGSGASIGGVNLDKPINKFTKQDVAKIGKFVNKSKGNILATHEKIKSQWIAASDKGRVSKGKTQTKWNNRAMILSVFESRLARER